MTQSQPARGRTGAFARSPENRVLAGVAGGLADRLGVDAVLIRAAFVVLTLAGGLGALLYIAAWTVSSHPPPGRLPRPSRTATGQQATALGLVVLGVLLLARQFGLWLGDGVVWPVAAAAAGSAVIWSRGGPDAGRDDRRLALPAVGEIPAARLVGGLVLVVGGMAAFLASQSALAALRDVALAVVVTAAGVGLLLGPWLARLVEELGTERRERIRSEERAAVAAHLHDSVLQTLALIQRSAEDPHRMVGLARRQERELRSWLYGGTAPETHADPGLEAGIHALVDDLEDDHGIAIDLVVSGSSRMGAAAAAMLGAVREAIVNAATHAGVDEVSVFVEARPDRLTAYVRDRGVGFDPAAVPADRRGLRDSIRGRIERAGGTVELRTVRGEGTEIDISVPREPATTDEEEQP